MSLFVAALNSGSNGNCYYVGNGSEAVLVDAGLSCRETEKRMDRLGLPMSGVKAVFISHEHSDHIFGLPVLAKKYRLPIYITDRTRMNSRLPVEPSLLHHFHAFQSIAIGALSVYAFPKFHDAADPHSFVVSSPSARVGIFTDIGNTCRHVVDNFQKCHAVFLESNYDETMLTNGKYPYHLKQRISGGRGHLSNTQAYELFVNYRQPFMTHLFLSHLSRENNSPEIVQQLFDKHTGETNIIVASRYKETPVYEVKGNGINPPLRVKPAQVQLSLF